MLNIRQHCRQQHGLSGKRLKKYQKKAWPVLIGKALSTEDESAGETDSSEVDEEEREARGAVIKEISILDIEFEGEDPDFLVQNYVESCVTIPRRFLLVKFLARFQQRYWL